MDSHFMSSRFVSIGLPVYNGGESLRRAIDALLVQSHRHFELIISDNASADLDTQRITEEYARRDSRIRLTRQSKNLGAFGNFIWVLNQARGEYFMWAAHDDCWSSNYIEALANRLDEESDAVLATPRSQVATTRRNGAEEQETVRAAPNTGPDATLAQYIDEFKSCLWIYGLYRTEWLKTAAPEWMQYPWFSGDVIWLWGVLLKERIVGNPAATFFYTADHRLRKKQTYRQTVQMWGTTFYQMARLSWQRLPSEQRLGGVFKAWQYYYRHHLRRKNLILTSIRLVKLMMLWCWIGVSSGIARIAKRVVSSFARISRLPQPESQSLETAPQIGEPRHAA
jgi:glycosyltransferase involved in cell wall biosynthesis